MKDVKTKNRTDEGHFHTFGPAFADANKPIKCDSKRCRFAMTLCGYEQTWQWAVHSGPTGPWAHAGHSLY